MGYGFLDIATTPAVKAVQQAHGSLDFWEGFRGDRRFDRFTDAERAFLAARDSFYMATVSEAGWPYVQHRGGPRGFLRVLDETMLGFADFSGNRQYLSVGNLSADDRVALIVMDYPGRRRLKLFAHAEARDLRDDPALAAQFAVQGSRARIERAILLRLEAFDWNCPQHITPRYTDEEIADATTPLHARLALLERENAALLAAARAGAGPSG